MREKNIPIRLRRLQVLHHAPDAHGRVAAFVEVTDEASARDIISEVRTSGPDRGPLSFMGYELWAAPWMDERPSYMTPVPFTIPSLRFDFAFQLPPDDVVAEPPPPRERER